MSARIRVVSGGEPTPEELAALTVALQPVAVETSSDEQPRASWGEAALLEGVGFRPFHSSVDLERYHRSIA